MHASQPKQNEIEKHKKIQIREMGTVLGIDSGGYIIKQVVKDIKEPWKHMTDEMTEIYKEILGNNLHSVYIRGSVARGTAIENISDADSIAVVSLEPGSFVDKQKLLREKGVELEKKYPFAIFAELHAKPLQPILDGKNRIFRTLLHTTAICTFGEDLAKAIPKVKPGPESVVVAYNYPNVLKEAIERFADPEFEVKPWHCRKLMRNTLRAGFETVMEREQVWTRDLYPSYSYFSKRNPNYKRAMYKTLSYALNPMTNREEVLSIANDLGKFVETQIEKYL